MANFVVKLVSHSANSSVVEIYRLANRGRTSLTTVSVGMTPYEQDPRAFGGLTVSRREVLTISGSPATSAEQRAATSLVAQARRALLALTTSRVG